MKNKKFALPKLSFKEITKEKKREALTNSIVLAVVLIVISLVLGALHNFLQPVISDMYENSLMGKMEELVPARSYKKLDIEFEKANSIISAYEAKNGLTLEGYCIETEANGYEAPVRILVGLDAEGSVLGVEILSMNETTGYGSRVNDKTFLSQFAGKNKELNIVRGEADTEEKISAISGATVSSTAVKNGVNNAIAAASQLRADVAKVKGDTK